MSKLPSLLFLPLLSFALGACTPITAPAPRQPDQPKAAAPAPPSKAIAATAPAGRPPPALVTVAMPGEPASDSLQEVRLISSSCQQDATTKERIIEARVAQMRVEVDQAFRTWVESQPGCWEQYRFEEAMRSGDGFGGGLGLSGVGSGGGGFGTGSIGLGSVSVAGRAGALGGPPPKAKSASGTNNQVAGVDEADFVKTDGRYVYVASHGALRIIEAMNPRVLSTTRLEGNVREMFVEGDRAVVYSSSPGGRPRCTYGYDCVFAGDGTATTILVLDVANRAAPRKVRSIDLSGSLMAARRVGNTVHTVVADGDSVVPVYQTWPARLDTCGTKEATVRAKFAALKLENERAIRAAGVGLPTLRENGVETPLCVGYKAGRGDGKAFTTVVSFDLSQDGTPASTSTIQSRPGAVFASANALYLSVVQHKRGSGGRWYSFYPTVDEVSEIHKFRIGQSPRDTQYVGSGVVPGHVLNQFAMDEWYGYLRVATTRGRVPSPDVRSVVSVLAESGGNLVRVGAVDDIAPGEDIRAVRFDDDRGYIVTFKKTDPLFVLDLYDPSRPRILGELKIPGYSTYMHRIDANHLLSIGFDADEKGDFAYFNGVILQLFDVTSATDPKLIHKETIGTRGSSSEAATNHLAFNYLGDRGLLAFPMTICEGGGDGQYGELSFSGLLVYEVSVEGGFKRLGGVDHGTRGANCQTWWSQANSVVKRSIFLDDLVYSIASDRLKVQRMGKFGTDVANIGLMR